MADLDMMDFKFHSYTLKRTGNKYGQLSFNATQLCIGIILIRNILQSTKQHKDIDY